MKIGAHFHCIWVGGEVLGQGLALAQVGGQWCNHCSLQSRPPGLKRGLWVLEEGLAVLANQTQGSGPLSRAHNIPHPL